MLAERVEREALAALHAAATAELRGRLGLRLETVGSALVSIAANDPGVVVNRAIGLAARRPGGQPAWHLYMGFDGREPAGAAAMFVHAGEAVEGDPQHSYKNIQKAGFEQLDVREDFVPAR